MSVLVNQDGQVILRAGRAVTVTPGGSGGPVDPPVPVGSLTLADFSADLTPFQREGTSKSIPVSGTCDPSLSTVRVRAIVAATGAAHTSWFDIPAVGGVFVGALAVPQGDWGKLQATDGTNTVTTANRFGVGIIGLLIGQSNMANRPAGGFRSPLGDPRAIEYNRSGVLRRLGNYRTDNVPPPNSFSDVSGYNRQPGYVQQTDARGDGYVYVANLVAQAVGCIVCLVERAVGGSNILDWTGQGSPANDKWQQAANAINDIGGDCEFALWYQGESNAATMSQAAMVSNIGLVQDRCHALTGRDATSFHFGVISLGPGSFSGSTEGQFGIMRAAHVQFGNNTPGAFYAGAAHDSQTNDSVHIIGECHGRVGARNALAVLSRFGIGVTGAGPRVTGANRSGSVITLTVQHTGGTALRDGAGGTGTALTGFEVKDAAGNVLTYTSAITSPTTIVLTATGTPATVSYAMMNNPHNTTRSDPKTAVVYASVPCDDVSLIGSTYGCPLQPFAAINITGS